MTLIVFIIWMLATCTWSSVGQILTHSEDQTVKPDQTVTIHFGDESELLEDDAISLTQSDPAASALLGSPQQEQEMLDEEEHFHTESSHSSCPAYEELLEVMDRATVGPSFRVGPPVAAG
ncbi:hypothetical protein QQF64_013405 [Cirrhinus molitorella]|uniref:Uncharacterized protein n=1 Tax=Cirrhinus molitorella TaxID=172907 RepID=A0ABR3LUL4_9TELE